MQCKVCNRTPNETSFYASIATHCKEHWKERVRNNRTVNIDHYRQFDRDRAMLPRRVKARALYIKTDEGKRAHNQATKKWSANNPKRRAAHNAINKALLRGTALPMPCMVCGKDAQAHHPDYDRPLDVIWLCTSHHREVHAAMKETA